MRKRFSHSPGWNIQLKPTKYYFAEIVKGQAMLIETILEYQEQIIQQDLIMIIEKPFFGV